MVTNCKICNQDIKTSSIYNLLFNDDIICYKCRKKFKTKIINEKLEGTKIEYLYEYIGLPSEMLIQYKECYDEYLYDIFLYKLKYYLLFKYYGYTLVFTPSSKQMLEERGFNHLELMFKDVRLTKKELLYKVKDISQKKLSAKQRYENKDNIKLLKDVELPNKILLVDDVTTTNTTILSAIRALKECKNLKVLVVFKHKT